MTRAISAAKQFAATRQRTFLLLQAGLIIALYYASGVGAFALSAAMRL